MEPDWAAEHLQTIRTLMERSALYRRALGPIMLTNGVIGLIAGLGPSFVGLKDNRGFCAYWMVIGFIAALSSFLQVRRQALKESEPFWSLPMRRVTQALLPAFTAGLAAGVVGLLDPQGLGSTAWLVAIAWAIAYGCALHAAGFFMQRGIKLLGWIFLLSGAGLLLAGSLLPDLRQPGAAHLVMGILFGGLHLACGVYLYWSESQRA